MCKTSVTIKDYSDYNLKTFPKYLKGCINENHGFYRFDWDDWEEWYVIVDINPIVFDSSIIRRKNKQYRLNVVAIIKLSRKPSNFYTLKVEKWFYNKYLEYRINYWKNLEKKKDCIDIKIEIYRDLNEYFWASRNDLKIK